MNWDFDEAFTLHNRRLLASTARQVGLQTAADIISTVWARAWDRRSTFDPARGDVGAWLNCIRRSAIADYFRANRIKLLSLQGNEPEAPSDNPPDLAWALDKLPDVWAAAVRAVYLEDRSYTEAAEMLGCSADTVYERTKHGIGRLRKIMAARV